MNLIKDEVSEGLRFHRSAGPGLFPREKNVRDSVLDYDPTNSLADSIIELGGLTDPVHVATLATPTEWSKMSEKDKIKKLQGVKGHRRVHTYGRIFDGKQDDRHENPTQHLSDYIDAILHYCESQDEIEDLKMDHSTQKGLSRYELGKCVAKKWNKLERPSRKQCCYELRDEMAANAPGSAIITLNTKLTEHNKIKWVNPLKKLEAEKQIYMETWSGTFQNLQRIFCPKNGSEWFKKNYRAYCYGEDAVKLTYEEVNKLTIIMDPEELKVAIQKVIDKNNTPKAKKVRMWTQKNLEDKYNDLKGIPTVATILGAVANDQNAVDAWPEMVEFQTEVSKVWSESKDLAKSFYTPEVIEVLRSFHKDSKNLKVVQAILGDPKLMAKVQKLIA